jgi:HSP20 family protein
MNKKELEIYDPFQITKKSFFDDIFEPFQSLKFPEVRMPLVDIIDEGKNFKVRVELPGIEKENVNVDAQEDQIKIEANHKKEEKEDEKDYYKYEIRTNSFSRIIQIPEKIIPEEVKGKLKDGILELNAPKANPIENKKSKKIEIE